MVVHLSPKAKALTLPLNWSQFLKTLIGAENYTLFQLPPQDRRPPFVVILCSISLYFVASRLFSSFARFLPLGYFFFRHEQSLEISRTRDDEHLERVEFLLRDTSWDRTTNYGMKCRSFTKWSLCQRTSRQHPSANSGSRHAYDKSVPLRKKSPASTFVSNGASRLPF